MDIKMSLKSVIYIFDLDHVKLSMGIFFILSCFKEILLHKLSGSSPFLCQKQTPKSCKLSVGSCANQSKVVC